MIPATQTRKQRTRFQRLTQKQLSCRFCKGFCWFYIGLIILFLEIGLVTVFYNNLSFSLAMTIIASGLGFVIITGVMALYELCRKPEEFLILRLEDLSRRQIAQDSSKFAETETAIDNTWL